MGQDKKLTFSLEVDQTSAQRTQRIIKELIGDAQKLAQILSGGGLISGGNVGGPMSGAAMRAGAGNGASRTTSGTNGTGGAMDSLSAVFQAQGKALKGLGEVSKDTSRVLSDSLTKAINEQKRSLADLDRQIAGLTKRYEDLGAEAKDALSTGAVTQKSVNSVYGPLQANVMSNMMGVLGQRTAANANLGTMTTALGGLNPPGALAKFGAWARQTPSMMGLAGGALAGFMTINDELANNPMRYSRMEASRGQLLGNPMLSTMNGDLKTINALRTIALDPSRLNDFQGAAGTSATLQARASNLWRDFSFNPFKAFGLGNMIAGQTSPQVQQSLMARQQEQIQNTITGDPMQSFMLDQFTGQASGRMGLMRTFGVGGGYLDRDRKIGDRFYHKGDYVSGLDHFLRPYRKRFDDGEIAGAFSGIEGAGTRTAAQGLLGTGLNAQAAGIGNAGSILGLTSAAGNRTAQSYMSYLLSQVGSRTMDVRAAGLIGQFGAEQMVNSGSAFNPTGLASVLSAGMSGGSADAMIAHQNIAGFQSMNRLTGGQIDPWQGAANLMSAIKAAPGTGIYAQDALSRASFSDLLRSSKGDVSPELAALGLGKGEASAQLNAVLRTPMMRLMRGPDAVNPNSKVGKMISGIMGAGGDAGAFLKKLGGSSAAAQNEAANTFGTILHMTGISDSFSTGVGQARMFLQSDRARGRRMAGDMAGGSREAQYKEDQIDRQDKLMNFIENATKGMFGEGGTFTLASKLYEEQIANASKSAQELAGSMSALSKVMQDVASGKITSKKEADDAFKRYRNQEAAAAAEATIKNSTPSLHGYSGSYGRR
jgi:hypothetical protein